MMKPGTTEALTVVRQAEFGFFLSDGENDILLHEREVTGTIAVDETVTVFLYHDHQNRLSATMAQPIIKNDEMGWLEVVGVRPTHGVFVYNGISRDLFVSMDELPTDRNEWPAVGDKLFCSLTWDKKGRLMGKLVKGSPITSQAILADDSWLNQNVKGTIYHFLDEGAALFIENGPIAFLHQDEANGIPRLGQLVHGRVQFVRDDGRVNITQRQLRTDQQKDDADVILAFLEARKAGGMPYTDKSSSEDIHARFGMSKAAFKRALGKLYKERKIEQRDGFTYLAEKK
ncbi:CvfB family protein [Shouchella patagoniensis]|uniref:CvfB family protein n=1 Tax=Shouchella patagoniensis TaxID=228576 RepID=UPI000995080B|nr:S1-like domain-containing RNA-binding protein [Shouchella patagoniensis]